MVGPVRARFRAISGSLILPYFIPAVCGGVPGGSPCASVGGRNPTGALIFNARRFAGRRSKLLAPDFKGASSKAIGAGRPGTTGTGRHAAFEKVPM